MSSFQGLLIREVPAVLFIDYIPYTTRVYFDKGGERHIREILRGGGGNMKTRVAVYEEGLSDLHGEGGTILRAANALPPPQKTWPLFLQYYMYIHGKLMVVGSSSTRGSQFFFEK